MTIPSERGDDAEPRRGIPSMDCDDSYRPTNLIDNFFVPLLSGLREVLAPVERDRATSRRQGQPGPEIDGQ